MKDTVSCPRFPACSGCSSIGSAYGWQVDDKLRSVRQLFEQADLPEFDAKIIERITPSPHPFGYRNRAKLVPAYGLSDGSRTIKLGLYREGSHDVTDIPNCPVQMDGINAAVEVVREAIASLDIPLYDEVTCTGELRFVTIRQALATSQLLVGMVTRSRDCPRIDELAQSVRDRCDDVVGVVQNVNPEPGNVIFGRSTHLLVGESKFEEMVCGVRILLNISSFFQVNSAVAERAYKTIIAQLELNEKDTLLDLYSGVGAIGLIAAGHLKQVLCVEEVPDAIKLSSRAAKLNAIENIEFVEGLVEEKLPELIKRVSQQRDRSRFPVVLNPPRKGVDPRVIEMLAAAEPERVAYLSCSPVTLLRDVASFVEKGYRLSHVELFDMFPQTVQVETLAILDRGQRANDGIIRRTKSRRP